MDRLVVAPSRTHSRRIQGGRPIPWLARLSEMVRIVAASKRTRYATAEIQELFVVMERSAQKLMKRMPRFRAGPGFEVSREDLIAFLERVEVHQDAGMDVPALLSQMLTEAPPILREQLPSPILPMRVTPWALTSLPESILIRRGVVEISGRTSAELAGSLMALAAVIETDEFAAVFELRKPVGSVAPEVRTMFEELEQMEAAHARSA